MIQSLSYDEVNDKVIPLVIHGIESQELTVNILHRTTPADINIYLEGSFSPEKAKRAAKLSFEKYCSVSKTLESTAKINHKVYLNGTQV